MTINLKEIRERAEKATPGPWEKLDAFNIDCPNCGEELICCDIASTDEYKAAYIQVCGMDIFAEPNTEFIATCNPTTVLALLDHIDKLTKAAKELLECIPIGGEDTIDDCICDMCPEHVVWNCGECPPVKLAQLVGLIKEPTTHETP